ncbi:hypothetical protein [Aeromonas sp. 1HA1]|uniref:hypothetical protein n=1 Tax=Aeromonas sp. 1HA1 TaxID=2699193 RepID=UPI0023DDE6CC|nr:hypothetical protein [Aeromonas sp. 1HA1]MDF2415699.1 hypothetical protein [Aeromonas sp. 1HA1]
MSIIKHFHSAVILSLMSFSVLAVPFYYDYTIEGKVVGVVSNQSATTPCYVAVKDINNSSRSGYYHAMSDLNKCQTARMAYALGLDTKLWAKIAPGTNSNDVIAIELHSGEVKWWN